MEKLYFYLFASFTLVPAVMAVLSSSPIYAVLNLALSFFSMAGLYILLSAEFAAVSQVIVYTGAIVILFLFVVMMINVRTTSDRQIPLFQKAASAFLALGLAAALILTILQGGIARQVETLTVFSAGDLAKLFLGDYLLPFELISLVLLLAIVGVVVLAKKDEAKK